MTITKAHLIQATFFGFIGFIGGYFINKQFLYGLVIGGFLFLFTLFLRTGFGKQSMQNFETWDQKRLIRVREEERIKEEARLRRQGEIEAEEEAGLYDDDDANEEPEPRNQGTSWLPAPTYEPSAGRSSPYRKPTASKPQNQGNRNGFSQKPIKWSKPQFGKPKWKKPSGW